MIICLQNNLEKALKKSASTNQCVDASRRHLFDERSEEPGQRVADAYDLLALFFTAKSFFVSFLAIQKGKDKPFQGGVRRSREVVAPIY